MQQWITEFLEDDRGAESIELGLTGVVVAGGTVFGLAKLRDKLAEKQDELVVKLDAATST